MSQRTYYCSITTEILVICSKGVSKGFNVLMFVNANFKPFESGCSFTLVLLLFFFKYILHVVFVCLIM